MQHGSIGCLIERPKSRGKCAHALVAVHFEMKDLHLQCIAWLGAFDVERTSERIVAFHQAQRVARFLNHITEGIHGIGL